MNEEQANTMKYSVDTLEKMQTQANYSMELANAIIKTTNNNMKKFEEILNLHTTQIKEISEYLKTLSNI